MFKGVNSGTLWGRFVEKTIGQKSHATVPLSLLRPKKKSPYTIKDMTGSQTAYAEKSKYAFLPLNFLLNS
jgi:hypothetical protein